MHILSLSTSKKLGIALVATVLVGSVHYTSHAQVRSSTNYQMERDSINNGGGFSDSANYTQQSTVGEIATGRSASSNFGMQAGFQQTEDVFITLNVVSDVSLTPAIPGITGGQSSGSTEVHVTTNNPIGYQLAIKAENSPAMQSGFNTIANYSPSGAVPDFDFVIPTAAAAFGFSPEGVDIVDRFKDNGSVCGVGTVDASQKCWDAVASSEAVIATGAVRNDPTGATTTLQFKVGVGSGAGQAAGLYTATTTVTALTL